jgi:urease accessory protein UreH
LGTTAGDLTEINIDIDFNAAAQCTPDSVEVVYV